MLLGAALILLGSVLVIYGAGELPETGYGLVALIAGAALVAWDQIKS